MKWRYTNIQHEPRTRLGLNPAEYCVLDIIYQSQTHPRYSFDGWARIGCHKIASFLGLSSGTVHKMFDRFEGWGLLEFDPTREYKRTTRAWYDVAYIEDMENEAAVQILNSVQKVNRGCSKSERSSVQKVNANRSKSEPKTNKAKKEIKEVTKEAAKAAPEKIITPKIQNEKRKKVAPKKEKAAGLPFLMWEVWAERHERLHREKPTQDAKFFKHLKDLAGKLAARIEAQGGDVTDLNICNNFGIFLDMLIQKGDGWYHTNFTPDIFNGKFLNIIQLLKQQHNEEQQLTDKYARVIASFAE